MSTRFTLLLAAVAMGAVVAGAESESTMDTNTPAATPPALEAVSFGLGCFWCGEAVFQRVQGVSKVESGYQGGHVDNPTYKQVCDGDTGHAEVIRVTFDPAQATIHDLLDIFWQAHDPTQANGQGNDIGPQYRSVIYCSSEAQKAAAEASLKQAQASGKFKRPIATEIEMAKPFYVAEDYHQNFFNNNKTYPYCKYVISPKLKKLNMPE